MPRAAQSDDAPKRSPRKRASAPRSTAERVPRRTAPRKRAPRKTVTPDSSVQETRTAPPEVRVERKAPTPVASTRASSRARQLQVLVSVVIIVIGVGASAAVGVTDDGQIDVVRTIEERNERIRTGQVSAEEGTIIVPVQNSNQRQADGGLRGLGVGATPPVIPDPLASSTASTTASSTDATASSTDDGTIETSQGEGESLDTETADEVTAEGATL